MILGPIVYNTVSEFYPDGVEVRCTSPDPRRIPFGAPGTELWVYNAIGQCISRSENVGAIEALVGLHGVHER